MSLSAITSGPAFAIFSAGVLCPWVNGKVGAAYNYQQLIYMTISHYSYYDNLWIVDCINTFLLSLPGGFLRRPDRHRSIVLCRSGNPERESERKSKGTS